MNQEPVRSLPVPPVIQSPIIGIDNKTLSRLYSTNERPRSADLTNSFNYSNGSSFYKIGSNENVHNDCNSPYLSDHKIQERFITSNEYELSPPYPPQFSEYEISNYQYGGASLSREARLQNNLRNIGVYKYQIVYNKLDIDYLLMSEGCAICGEKNYDACYIEINCIILNCSHVLHLTCALDVANLTLNTNHTQPLIAHSDPHNFNRFHINQNNSRLSVFTMQIQSPQSASIVESISGKYNIDITLYHPISNAIYLHYSNTVQSCKISSSGFDRIMLPKEYLIGVGDIEYSHFRLAFTIQNHRFLEKIYYQGEWIIYLQGNDNIKILLSEHSTNNIVNISFSYLNNYYHIDSFTFDYICSPLGRSPNIYYASNDLLNYPQNFSPTVSRDESPNVNMKPAPMIYPESPVEHSQILKIHSSGSKSANSPNANNLTRESSESRDRKRKKDISASKESILNYKGKICEMSSTQSGSKSLQDLLKKMKPEDFYDVEDEIVTYCEQIITNQFGNYFLQNFLRSCPDEVSDHILESLQPRMSQICCHKTGTFALQNIIGSIIRDDQHEIISNGLKDYLLIILNNQQSIHVINKFLNRFEPGSFQFLIDFIESNFNEIVHNQFGITILRTCLLKCNPEQKNIIITLILQHARSLCWDEFGNYAIQYLLDYVDNIGGKVYDQLKGQIVALSKNKFGSNVIEKCLTHGDYERGQIIRELIVYPDISSLIVDKYSNFVIQKAINLAKGYEKQELAKAIKPCLNVFDKETKTVYLHNLKLVK